MDQKFYERDAVTVAKDLVGKVLVCGDKRLRISETEVYCGEEDMTFDKKQIVTQEELPYIVSDVLKHDVLKQNIKVEWFYNIIWYLENMAFIVNIIK